MSGKTDKAKRKAESVKVWRIDVRNYKVEVADRDAAGNPIMERGRMKMVRDDFDVKGSLASILFNQELRLSVEETFEAKEVADKIRAAKDYVLLDSKEMDRVRASYKVIKGIPEQQLEFFKRIRDAEEIEAAASEPEDEE